MLAGVSKEASDFLRLKYAGDHSKRKIVAYRLANKVIKRQRRSKKNPSFIRYDPDLVLALAHVAVDEALGDGLCGTCNGKGWVDTGLKRIDCFRCDGGGRRRLGDIAIANKLDLSVWEYRQYWKSVMERQMLGTLASYEGDLFNAFRSRL